MSENGEQLCWQDHLPDPARGEREQREQGGLQGVAGEAEAAVGGAGQDDGAHAHLPHEHAAQPEGGEPGTEDTSFFGTCGNGRFNQQPGFWIKSTT